MLSNSPYVLCCQMLTLTRKPSNSYQFIVSQNICPHWMTHADLDVDNNADQEETPQHNATGPQKVSHSFIPQQQEQQQLELA